MKSSNPHTKLGLRLVSLASPPRAHHRLGMLMLALVLHPHPLLAAALRSGEALSSAAAFRIRFLLITGRDKGNQELIIPLFHQLPLWDDEAEKPFHLVKTATPEWQ
ncbi:hypothetical protein U9M48_020530, partial [Paspalum notatum var. saurae]